MHAIVREGSKEYYISPVFGYLGGNYQHYYVWNKDRSRIFKLSAYETQAGFLTRGIIIVDSDQTDWTMDENGIGCVSFLTLDLLEDMVCMNDQPEDILKKCRDMDAEYEYEERPQIRTDRDVENLMWAAGCFHDAFIEKEEIQEDGKLYVLFDGVWGCRIEMWFWGDLEYDTSSRNPDEYDPYWFDSTILLEGGFVYFGDDEGMTLDDFKKGYCYFKSRNVQYHVIPE